MLKNIRSSELIFENIERRISLNWTSVEGSSVRFAGSSDNSSEMGTGSGSGIRIKDGSVMTEVGSMIGIIIGDGIAVNAAKDGLDEVGLGFSASGIPKKLGRLIIADLAL